MDRVPKIIDFDKLTDRLKGDIDDLEKNIDQFESCSNTDSMEIQELRERLQTLMQNANAPCEHIKSLDEECGLLNKYIDDIFFTVTERKNEKFSKLPKLTLQDATVCFLFGLLSCIIDVIFVGTPEVVKIYRGGENFDGSILTGMLRKIGSDTNTKTGQIFKWFSNKCKVPYDISLKSGALTPDNHRLRSLGHDPFFGLLFAVADIVMGTTTCIDNNGKLKIIVNINKAPTVEKWLSVIFYVGHIISDVNTARGIPIPGFFSTQFFTVNIIDSSISEIAESMYKDGYDLRHMISMGIPVWIKDMLLNIYIKLNEGPNVTISSVSMKEKYELDIRLKTLKMRFIANSVGTIGNAVKFVVPPNCANPCALNAAQWFNMIRDSIKMYSALTRDTAAEEALFNRQKINEIWETL